MQESVTIRPAGEEDVATLYRFICELAEYEKLSDKVVSTENDIRAALFGEASCAEALLALEGETPVGFALFFTTFSTFVGRPGIYLEDLYVTPEARGNGFGKQLLIRLAQIALERHCGRIEWSVLNWNRPAIDFYKNLDAIAMDEWTVYRLAGEAIGKLASDE